jgi:hypothetical protein
LLAGRYAEQASYSKVSVSAVTTQINASGDDKPGKFPYTLEEQRRILDAIEREERRKHGEFEPLPHDARKPPPERPRRPERDSRDGRDAIQIFTAEDLAKMELPEPKWAVEGIVPAGLSLLAGKPKLGKSWLALLLALAVAMGGVALGSVPVELGDVLYLALEDTRRRLKDRLAKLAAQQGIAKWPATLHLASACPRQDKGGLYALAEWLDAHPQARLVVVDTWPRFRPFRTRGRDSYEEDYQHASELKAVADKYGVAIHAIAHCRKLDATDPLDEVSGTLGLTGAADGVAVLKRERGQHDATLFLTGRDMDEREIALRWDAQYALWSILGDAEEYRLSNERKEIIELLERAGEPLSPMEAADRLEKPRATVKGMLWRMAEAGQIERSGAGKYTSANRANRANQDAERLNALWKQGQREARGAEERAKESANQPEPGANPNDPHNPDISQPVRAVRAVRASEQQSQQADGDEEMEWAD